MQLSVYVFGHWTSTSGLWTNGRQGGGDACFGRASPRKVVPRIGDPPGNGSEVPRAEAARAPRLARIRIKHHLLQFLLYIKRLFSNNLTTDVNRNVLGGARDHDGRLISKNRHGRDAAALHDVDELPVPLVRGHGVLDVLVERNNMRFPLLVDLRRRVTRSVRGLRGLCEVVS